MIQGPQKAATGWKVLVLMLLAVALQTTWLARWQPMGIRFELPLLIAVSAAILGGWEAGLGWGALVGWILGAVAGSHLGPLLFSRATVGALCGLCDRKIAADNPLVPPLMGALATLGVNVLFVLAAPTDFRPAVWFKATAMTMVAHALLMVVLHPLVSRLVAPPARWMFAHDY